MSELKTFLKILSKVGYPNPKLESISKMVSYDLEEFLPDLFAELGQDGVDKFCKQAIKKLEGNEGIKVEFGHGEYVIIDVNIIGYDEDESPADIIASIKILDSKILASDDEGNDTYKTLDQISDEVDMGEWSDYDDLKESIKQEIYQYIHTNCGFGIWIQ